MINRPLAYKGPVDHLTHFFDEQTLMSGLDILLSENLVNWQNIRDEEYIKGTCLIDGKFFKQVLYWPLSESLGSCTCKDKLNDESSIDNDLSCEHLAALAIESKTRLQRLPPAIKQQKKMATGKYYIQHWLKSQDYDPFSKMARHRVIYLLDKVDGGWSVSLHKSYLTKQGDYQVKAEICINTATDAELDREKNTKYFSLLDKQILFLIRKKLDSSNIVNNKFVFVPDLKSNRLVKSLVKTNRFFWQSPHRNPLTLSSRNKDFWRGVDKKQVEEIQQESGFEHLSVNYLLDLKHNVILEYFKEASDKSKKLFYQLSKTNDFKVQPSLEITSQEVSLGWEKHQVYQVDVAKLVFYINGKKISLKNILPLILEREVNTRFTTVLSDFLLQIENLSVLDSCYELPIVEQFHFGDRVFESHLSHMLPILVGLKELGWLINVDKGFRLNKIENLDWYVDIRQGYNNEQPTRKINRAARFGVKNKIISSTTRQLDLLSDEDELPITEDLILKHTDGDIADRSFDWFDLEVGVKVADQQINLIPYIVSLIQRGELSLDILSDSDKKANQKGHSTSHINIKLESGETLAIERNRINRIFSSFVELNDQKSLTEERKLRFTANQVSRLMPLVSHQESLLSENDSAKISKKQTDSDGIELASLNIDWLNGKKLAEKAKAMDVETGVQAVKIPRTLKAKLRSYQKTGVNWLQFLRHHRLSGILADDMGLGKTLQALAHILLEKKEGRLTSPCIVIAPKSVTTNWLQECHKFAPSLKVLLLTGSDRHKLFPKIQQYDLIITSYGLVLRDINKLLNNHFHLLILDEAQVIKNTRSKITTVVKELRSSNRLCMTGTPMENHLGELWSLFEFLMPEFLGSEYQFNQLYRQPIEKNQDYYRQSLLAKRVAPLMLRRTKNEVAKELPSKTEMKVLIPLEEGQADLYETVRTSMFEQVQKAMTLETKHRNQFLIGNALLKLRQVCCHTNLIKLESAQNMNSSAKVRWLKDKLPSMVNQGRRILLFSSFTSMLDILAEELKEMEIPFLMLTGKSKHRGALVQQFQGGEIPVFLISLKAGGVGLNLTAADTVIHYDPWWNPAAEQQANDRAYRIGQDKPVFVYKLITQGTVEEKIQQMQKQKNDLAQGLYNQEDLSNVELTGDDWQALFQPIEGFG
jgi:SNF2 family DNA or RNA helicase